jgi:hypothetical protein
MMVVEGAAVLIRLVIAATERVVVVAAGIKALAVLASGEASQQGEADSDLQSLHWGSPVLRICPDRFRAGARLNPFAIPTVPLYIIASGL